MNITDRDEVGRLWLPWCVDRDQSEVPIRIERDPDRRHEARQLRVSDLTEVSARVELSNYLRDDGVTSVWSSIEHWAGAYSKMADRPVLDEAKLFETPEDALGWAAYDYADLRTRE
jgi:hypothetical protein